MRVKIFQVPGAELVDINGNLQDIASERINKWLEENGKIEILDRTAIACGNTRLSAAGKYLTIVVWYEEISEKDTNNPEVNTHEA